MLADHLICIAAPGWSGPQLLQRPAAKLHTSLQTYLIAACPALHFVMKDLSTLNRVANHMRHSQDQVYSFAQPTTHLSQERTAVKLKHPPVAKHPTLYHALGKLSAFR